MKPVNCLIRLVVPNDRPLAERNILRNTCHRSRWGARLSALGPWGATATTAIRETPAQRIAARLPLRAPCHRLRATPQLPSTTEATTPAQSTCNTGSVSSKSSYPPIYVENLPHWTRRFALLTQKHGRAQNALPFEKGVRFLLKTPEEYRAVQKHLIETAYAGDKIAWHCFTRRASTSRRWP